MEAGFTITNNQFDKSSNLGIVFNFNNTNKYNMHPIGPKNKWQLKDWEGFSDTIVALWKIKRK